MALPEQHPTTGEAISQLHRDNLKIIAILAMGGGWSLLLAYAIGYLTTQESLYQSLINLQVIFSIILTIVWFLQHRNQRETATWLLYSAVFAVVVIYNLLVAGMGLVLGLAVAAIFTLIAWQIVPTNKAQIASVLTILGGIGIYSIDTYLAPVGRPEAGLFLKELLTLLSGLVFFILIINSFRSITFHSIGAQIQVSFLTIAFIPLLILAVYQLISMTNNISTQANNNLLVNANNFAEDLDEQLFAILRNIEEDADRQDVVAFFNNPSDETTLLTSLAARYPSVLSYGFLDKNGVLIIDNRGATGVNESQQTYFNNAANIRISYLSDVVRDELTGEGVFFASSPVYDEQGRLLGVIRIRLSAAFLQTAAEFSSDEISATTTSTFSPIVAAWNSIFEDEAKEENSEGLTLAIIDDENIILAHSSLPELKTNLLVRPEAEKLASLQQSGRLPALPTILELEQLAKQLQSGSTDQVFASAIYPTDPDADRVAFAELQSKPWKVIVAQDAILFLAPVLNSLLTQLLTLVSVMAAVYFGALLTSSLLVKPINQLALTAQHFSKGNLQISFRLDRKDELGVLGNVLDNASQQIRELLETLEHKVTERTNELAVVNEKNQRRAAQLETIAQVARAVTSLRDLNELLPEIANQISASFGYYHVGIFLVDENREFAVLRASNSEGGQKMLQRGHKLKIGRQGIVGNVTNSGQYRTALDVGGDAIFFNNPDLPLTRSEIALPLNIGDNIIGALDVQSTEPDAFSAEDIKSLQLLSDQISIAIENARLFEETRTALTQIQQIYSEASTAGWQALLTESGTSGYRFSRGSVEPLHKKSELSSLRSAETLEIPISLRGEKLGALKIRRAGHQAAWSEAEIRMYQSIVERMSFALENARLFSDARRRANLERRAAEATAKISSTVQVETILRTAAEEISQILDGSEVLVQIQPEALDNLDKR